MSRLSFFEKRIPYELRQLPQWVLWKFDDIRRTGDTTKKSKVPYGLNGRRASTTNSETWSSYEDVVQTLHGSKLYDGIGFVFTSEDPYVGIDLDNALEENGAIRPEQQKILQNFGSYSEISQSGRGIHIIVKGNTPDSLSLKKGDAFGPGQGLEIYQKGRFFIMTGDCLPQYSGEILDGSATLQKLFEQFKPGIQNTDLPTTRGNTVAPVALLEDEDILEKAFNAKNGEKFTRLWDGTWNNYPSDSEADAALCCELAYWTRDPSQIDRLFRRSGLYRPKWDESRGVETYGAITISNALSFVKDNTCGNGEESDPLHCTDLGNAARLVKLYGNNLRFCDALGGWFIWEKSVWKKDASHVARKMAQQTVKQIHVEASKESNNEKAETLKKHAFASERAPRILALLEMAKPDLAVKSEEFDVDPLVINCPNGILDLNTGVFSDHTSEAMLSKVTRGSYDPKAGRGTWTTFLEQIFDGNEGLIRYVQKAIGYSLTGDTSEQCIFILLGEGANGKTTFMEAVNHALGDYATNTSPETILSSKYKSEKGDDIASLMGSRLVATSETGIGRELDESKLKLISGGDKVSCRKLYKEYFTYTPTWKLWMLTNHKPLYDGGSLALSRRIRLIPFTVTIPPERQDKALLDKLKYEASGILSWAVDGAFLWMKEGLGDADEIQQATEQYRRDQDSVGKFLEEECRVEPDEKVKIMDFRSRYKQWCSENGEREIARKELNNYLQKFKISKKKSNGQWMYFGVGVDQSDQVT